MCNYTCAKFSEVNVFDGAAVGCVSRPGASTEHCVNPASQASRTVKGPISTLAEWAIID